ncbi:MAG: hypothetical protein HKN28_06490 [Alphaproteobacteria bacterium]|nr:hypothetical protein [Alphaproteobacteria bacterium]
MSNSDKTSLLLSLPTPPGNGGQKAIDLDHRWSAPFRKSFLEGGPPGTWRYSYTDDFAGVPRMLGAFVYTTGNRTLFCPGFEVLVMPLGSEAKDGERVEIDHVTLDPRKPNGSWASHIAIRGCREDGPRGLKQTSSEDDGFMFAWFSILLPDFEVLEGLPQSIILPHDVPSSDLPARSERTLGNYQGPPANIRFAERPVNEPYYLQFDVWVTDQPEWQQNLSANAMNYVSKKRADQSETKRWKGQTDIDLVVGQCGLRILTSIRPGEVDYPCILLPQFSKGEALLA